VSLSRATGSGCRLAAGDDRCQDWNANLPIVPSRRDGQIVGDQPVCRHDAVSSRLEERTSRVGRGQARNHFPRDEQRGRRLQVVPRVGDNQAVRRHDVRLYGCPHQGGVPFDARSPSASVLQEADFEADARTESLEPPRFYRVGAFTRQAERRRDPGGTRPGRTAAAWSEPTPASAVPPQGAMSCAEPHSPSSGSAHPPNAKCCRTFRHPSG
jgi:hypothetical protein